MSETHAEQIQSGGGNASGMEPKIHAMPKEYRGLAFTDGRKKTEAPKPIVVAQPVERKSSPMPEQVVAPAAPASSMRPQTASPKVKRVRMRSRILMALGILLLLGAAVLYVFWTLPKPPAQNAIREPVATITPAPEPEPTPEPSPEPEVQPAPEPVPVKPTAGLDSDSDGLTDEEETGVFGTEATVPDTDGDSFIDGNEVFHLYDPRVPEPARLADGPSVRPYKSEPFGYTLLMPSAFVFEERADGTLLMKAKNGETIEIAVLKNDLNIAAQEWFGAQYPDRINEVLRPYTMKTGTQAFQSEDRMTTYVPGEGVMLVVSYRLGEARTIEYRQTYAMILNSLLVK